MLQVASLHRGMETLRIDVGEVRRDLHALSDLVARIDGALAAAKRRGGAGTW